MKTTLQKRNEEIASLKEENERLRASLAAVKNELKEERESRKGGLFSRLGKRGLGFFHFMFSWMTWVFMRVLSRVVAFV